MINQTRENLNTNH